MQNIIFKKSSKRSQNPSRYYNSITNLSFNTSQNIVFQNPHIKIDLLPRGQNPLSYYNESKHNILAKANKIIKSIEKVSVCLEGNLYI